MVDLKPFNSNEISEKDLSLTVVIPTTHAVDSVRRLITSLRALLDENLEIVLVDNGPTASDVWDDVDVMVVDRQYLGSEGSFTRGLVAARSTERYLLLDHDAELSEDSLEILLGAAKCYPDSVLSANQNGDGRSWRVSDGDDLESFGKKTIPVLGAPWSGLLLTARARQVILEQNSGISFYGMIISRFGDCDSKVSKFMVSLWPSSATRDTLPRRLSLGEPTTKLAMRSFITETPVLQHCPRQDP